MKTVALTGATGFVGRVTLDRLIAAGWHVRALTRRDQPKKAGVTWVHGRLDDAASLNELCKGADAVLHVAGVVNAPDAAGFESGNVTGTANMLAAAQSAGIDRFVHISSLAARHPALSMYGASKAKAEELVTASPSDWTVVRPPGVYGPGDTEMFDMFRIAAKGWALLPPRGRVSVIHVDDLARLLVTLLSSDNVSKHIYEADDGATNGWSHEAFARAIGVAVGRKVTTLHAPGFLLKCAGWADRAVRGPKAKLTPDRANYLAHPDWTINPDAVPSPDLWKPEILTPKGLQDTVNWYRKQGWM
ncbi:NAD-dependent epimerase/dehydratase family protein [Sphingorhabdus sp.]|uniref:NAD-dependent epimerase/dehydratase family protein n=1 Tax=Sphingorhabdus sp. TaxID=1902408 RepID=UPI00391A0CC3